MKSRGVQEIIAGTVAANGQINNGDDFVVRRTAVGAYQMTFPKWFRLVALTCNTGGSAVTYFVGSYAERSCLISTSPATDSFFSFIAVGYRV